MAQWLRAPSALAEDVGLVPSIHMAALQPVSPVPEDLKPCRLIFFKTYSNKYTQMFQPPF